MNDDNNARIFDKWSNTIDGIESLIKKMSTMDRNTEFTDEVRRDFMRLREVSKQVPSMLKKLKKKYSEDLLIKGAAMFSEMDALRIKLEEYITAHTP